MRYEKEARIRYLGDADLAKQYIPLGRKLLGGVVRRDKTLGGLTQSLVRKDFLNGLKIEAGFVGDLLYINIDVRKVVDEEELPGTILLTRWEPEGIMLTPRTLANLDGWGLPHRSYLPTGEVLESAIPGTVGGSLPQVLINRFPNNRYMDTLEGLTGLPENLEPLRETWRNPRLRSSYEEPPGDAGFFHKYWTNHSVLFSYGEGAVTEVYYERAEIAQPGLYTGVYGTDAEFFLLGTPVVLQPELDETKTEEWHTHRPEELLYPNQTDEGIFQVTNDARVDVGEARVHRQLRGDANAAWLGAFEVATSELNYFGHSHPEWTPGFRTATGRLQNAVGYTLLGEFSDNPVENEITFGPGFVEDAESAFEIGQLLAQAWVDSPRHYANMTNSQWTDFDVYPPHRWEPPGTVGAQMHAGGYGPTQFEIRWDTANSSLSSWGTVPFVTGPQQIAYGQVFTAREAWLPVYDEFIRTLAGTVGLFERNNPLNKNFPPSNMPGRVGKGRTIYDLPVAQRWPDGTQNESDFLAVAGAAAFMREGDTWIRMVYWSSSDALVTEVPVGQDYLRMTVVVFPEGLCESGVLPWRADNSPEWEIEATHTFTLANRYLPKPENRVAFNSTGTDFVFEVERITTDTVSSGVYGAGGIDFGDPEAMAFPAASAGREAYRYTSEDGQIELLLPMQVLPQVTVTATSSEGNSDDSIHTYEKRLDGQYQIWPHFDDEDNVVFVTLDIDEYQIQVGSFFGRSFDVMAALDMVVNPDAPFEDQIAEDPEKPWYGWRIRKMIFPTGKVFTYMQQYVWHYQSVEFVPDTRLPAFNVFPGTGENFFVVIHSLDIPTASIIYSKHQSLTKRMPLPSSSESYYHTGDSTYVLDAQLGEERVEQVFATYPMPTPDDLRPYVTSTDTLSYPWDRDVVNELPVRVYLFNTFGFGEISIVGTWSLYNSLTSPSAIRRQIVTLGAVSGGGTMLSNQRTTRGFPSPVPKGEGFTSTDKTSVEACYFDFVPVDDYRASCFSGYDFLGESSTSLNWLNRAQQGRTPYCGFWHNIAPLFSNDDEVEAKVVEYDGRWVARLRVRHINQAGWKPPAPWQTLFPPATDPQDALVPLSAWTFREADDAVPEYDDSVVHLLSNFDLDEATGIDDIYDIVPFGRAG